MWLLMLLVSRGEEMGDRARVVPGGWRGGDAF